MQTTNAPSFQQMTQEISAESQSDSNPKIAQLAKFFAAQLATEDGKSDPSTQKQES
jgi:hypothetical protein